MNLLRPAFDAAYAAVDLPVNRQDALWSALVGQHAVPRPGRPVWSKEATILLEPLRIELDTLRKHVATRAIFDRYSEVSVQSSPTAAPIRVMDAYNLYHERVHALRDRLHAALKAGGHLAAPSTLDMLDRDTLDVIVANERAAGRYAGALDWTQWEDPNVIRKLTRIFELARNATTAGRYRPRGRVWQPYQARSHTQRGAAATHRLNTEWTAAFHEAVRTFDRIFDDPRAQGTGPLAPLAAFYASLRTPPVQSAIGDAIRHQITARRGPSNPALKPTQANPTRNIWHTLAMPVRMRLASTYHQALMHAYEGLRGMRAPDAIEYSPTQCVNLWELSEQERAKPQGVTLTVQGVATPAALDRHAIEYEPPVEDALPVWEDVPPPEGYVNNPGTLTEEWLLANSTPEKGR